MIKLVMEGLALGFLVGYPLSLANFIPGYFPPPFPEALPYYVLSYLAIRKVLG